MCRVRRPPWPGTEPAIWLAWLLPLDLAKPRVPLLGASRGVARAAGEHRARFLLAHAFLGCDLALDGLESWVRLRHGPSPPVGVVQPRPSARPRAGLSRSASALRPSESGTARPASGWPQP